MCDYLDTTAGAIAGLVNLPGEYGYLLIGLVLGLLLGWIIGRQRPKSESGDAVALMPVDTHDATGAKPAGVSLVVNGKTVEVAPDVMEAIQALVIDGKIIEAIKRLREASGLNLAAAKSVVESLGKVIG